MADSNMKPVIVALVASVVIVSLVFVGAIFFFNGQPTTAPDVADIGAPAGADEGARPPEEAEGPRDTAPDVAVLTHPDEKKERLTVRVLEEGSQSLIRDASIVIRKAVDGELGDAVFPTERGSSRSSSGEFKVALVPGAYIVRAQAPSYSSRTERVTLIEGRPTSVDLLLGRGLSISGRVTDRASGRGIGGARIAVGFELGAPDDDIITKLIDMTTIAERAEEPVAEAISAPDGSYQIDGLKPQYYSVFATADQHAPQERKHVRPTARNVDFRLSEGSEFPGRVVAALGGPIAGARVNVYPEVDSNDIFEVIAVKARPALARAETDSNGEFVITSLGQGLYNFEILAAGFQPGRETKVAVYEGTNPLRTFELKAGLVLGGRVVGPDGETVAGAKVKPIKSGGDVREQNMKIDFGNDGSILSDAEGGFAFDTLEPGRYSLLVSHDDYASEQLRDVELGNMNLEVTLPRGGAISGHVYEAASGDPIPGARITVTDLLDVKKTRVTDGSGYYYVGGLTGSKRGKRFLAVQAEGYARVNNYSVNVEDGRITENQDFHLDATGSVVGSVVNSAGSPVDRARVMAKRRSSGQSPVPMTVGSAQTKVDGTFFLEHVESGDETWLEVVHADYLQTDSSPFNIAPSERVELASPLVLTLGGAVSGTVVDAGGRGVDGVQVSVRFEGDTAFDAIKTDTTDNRGRFRIRGLVAGLLDLQAKHPAYLEEVVRQVQIEEGRETRDMQIVLRQGNRLAGVVIDQQDRAVRSAAVVVREFAGGVKELRGSTDAQGRFVFNNLAGEEPVDLEITHPDYSPYIAQQVAVGGEELTIRLAPLGGIAGVVVDTTGAPVASFSVQPRDAEGGDRRVPSRTFQDEDGRFEFRGIPAGTYTVAINAPGYAAVSIPDVVVQDGGIFDVGRAVLEEGGVVDGRVIDAETKQPVAGARVRVQGGRVKFLPSSPSPARGESMGSQYTDETGYFKFTQLRGGQITVLASHDGYVEAKVAEVDSNDAATSRDLAIELSRGGEIVGVVLDAQGAPVRGMKIYLTGQRELAEDRTVGRNGQSGADGSFSFDGLRPGLYRVTALDFKRKERPSVDVEVAGGGSSSVRLVFEGE